MGSALVGLRRAFPQSKRTDLSAGSYLLRIGRDGAKLLFAAIIYEAVSSSLAEMEIYFVRYFSHGFYFGRDMVCCETQLGIRNYRIRHTAK